MAIRATPTISVRPNDVSIRLRRRKSVADAVGEGTDLGESLLEQLCTDEIDLVGDHLRTDRSPVVERHTVMHPLPQLAARDLRGRGVLHQ